MKKHVHNLTVLTTHNRLLTILPMPKCQTHTNTITYTQKFCSQLHNKKNA